MPAPGRECGVVTPRGTISTPKSVQPRPSPPAGRRRLDELVEQTYADLRRIADRLMRNERVDHTLQATELVHEAYLRLRLGCERDLHDAERFFPCAATAFRRILVDHARRRAGPRRRGDARSSLDPESLSARDDTRVLAVDRALSEFEQIDPYRAKLVELRFFARLTVPEVATVLGSSESTIARDWRLARAWLARQLEP